MRFFLSFMIAALAFGIYSNTVHAMSMGQENCAGIEQAKADDCDHVDATSDHDHAKKHEKAKGQCMDCAHCCAASVAILSTKPFDISMTGASFVPVSPHTHALGSLTSFLRPPKTLA